MIRLDGNSLAAFRGAGVAGTVQSVAGCELFGAAREPKWASPYSAAATRALKAQFPTQWATIRDYGWEHPEIVGYMNAYAPEDAKIAYSLVEGIGTRYCVGNGTGSAGAYLKTQLYPTNNATIDILFELGSTNDNYCGIFGGCTSSGKFEMNYWYSSNLYYIGGTQVASGLALGVKYRFVDAGASQSMYKDGVLSGTFNINKGTYTSNTPLAFFCLNRGNSIGWRGPHKISYAKVKDGSNELYLVPFIHKDNGTDKYGMIDLLTGTFYPDATGNNGFTISESPA